MSLVVQKYGGTSVGDASRVRRVAAKVAARRSAGDDVVVVVSAMGETTDDLIGLAAEVSSNLHAREMDMLLTAGERISMALLAMAIQDLGVEAMSLTGSQAGILTDPTHGGAKIRDIRPTRIEEALREGRVVIVAGFQGVSPDTKEVTTLGRGGSDATAVALAAALGADACEILTDVDGVFTADPRLVETARRIDEVTFDEMLELAAAGAGVLMPRAVEFGMRFRIPIHVASSFEDGPGTWVREKTMEQAIVRGIAHDTSAVKITVHGVPDQPGVAAALFEPLAEAGVSVDMIVQNVSQEGITDISFTVPRDLAETAGTTSRAVAAEIGASGVGVDTDVARLSIVGSGMRAEPRVAATMFRELASEGVNIDMISTSSIRVSCVIAEGDVPRAMNRLHRAFDLDGEADG